MINNKFYFRSSSVRQGPNFTNDRVKPGFQTSTVTVYNKFKKKVDQKYLEVGQNVMCIHNKEMATVKYVGHTEFATGVWVGLEMKKKIGMITDFFLWAPLFWAYNYSYKSPMSTKTSWFYNPLGFFEGSLFEK